MTVVLGSERSRRVSIVVAGFLVCLLLLSLSAVLGCLGHEAADGTSHGGTSHEEVTSAEHGVRAAIGQSMTAQDECAEGHGATLWRVAPAVPAAAPSVPDGVHAGEAAPALHGVGSGPYSSVVADSHSRVSTPLLRLICVLRT